MATHTIAEEIPPHWSLRRRIGLILVAGLVGYPLSIGPTLFVLYQARLVAHPLTGKLFNGFYAPLHWTEAQSPAIAAMVDWYIRLFLEVQTG